MQKNWHILYIRKNSEKRVSAALNKNNIQNFCPVKCSKISHFGRSVLHYEPLFGPYLFANLTESDFSIIKKVKNIVNVVHWMDKPAFITDEEIEVIKEITRVHQNISIEKYRVKHNEVARISDVPSYSVRGNAVLIKTNSIKVHLPSLGLVMIVEIERDNIMFGEKKPKPERSSRPKNNNRGLELPVNK